MATAQELVPPLSAGDRLSRGEFLRRWEAHSAIKNAELIGEIVYLPSPVSVDHGDMDADLGIWLGAYRVATSGTALEHNSVHPRGMAAISRGLSGTRYPR